MAVPSSYVAASFLIRVPLHSLYQRRTGSSCQGETHSVCVSADVISSCGTDQPLGPWGDSPTGMAEMVEWQTTHASGSRGERQFLILQDVELLGHQAVQFRVVAIQVVQHLGHRPLHRLERLMP